MNRAKQGDTVKVHYTGKLDDGTVFDASDRSDPLEFTIGEDELIPGFEQAVIGMSPGESKTERIVADQAYGPYMSDMVLQVERSTMPPDLDPQVGEQLHIQQEDGETFPVVVVEVSDHSVTLDANHPLAGKDLIFEIELLEIA